MKPSRMIGYDWPTSVRG